MAPQPRRRRPSHDKAEAEQQRVAMDAAATNLLSEEVCPVRLVEDVRQHRKTNRWSVGSTPGADVSLAEALHGR